VSTKRVLLKEGAHKSANIRDTVVLPLVPVTETIETRSLIYTTSYSLVC
jgi:hypothetical protein